MPRPRIPRCIRFKPGVYYFKPQGIPLRMLDEVVLFPDEIEALKLYEIDKLEQEEAAKKMKISQPTFARILGSARKKIAQAIIKGKAIKVVLAIFLLFLALSFFSKARALEEEILEGKVVKILKEEIITQAGQQTLSQQLEVLVTRGTLKGKEVTVEAGTIPLVGQQKYQIGDKVLLSRSRDLEGNDVFYISDYIRRLPLLWLFLIFLVLVVVVGHWRGLSSLFGLGVSFLVIFTFILPNIYAGREPVFIAIVGSLFILPVTFYLSHGFNKKTTVALIGTFIALIITGILAKIFVEATRLTGYASEEAGFLQVAKKGTMDIKGLLLAGMIIGALGILDDITVSQAAVVEQLKKANSKIRSRQLFWQAMSVGQDHIASMVNTLVLVYTGAALPLLLLFVDNPMPFSQVINYEIIAEEIVRTLVGSIGLISAMPITTFLASKNL
jgi:uncharacterized membrane protein